MYDSWEINDGALTKFYETGELPQFFHKSFFDDFYVVVEILILFLPRELASSSVKVFTKMISKIPCMLKLADILGIGIAELGMYLWNASLKGVDIILLLKEFQQDKDTNKLVEKLQIDSSELATIKELWQKITQLKDEINELDNKNK